MNLTDDILAGAIKTNKIFKIYDGKGLYIEVPPAGNLRWRYRYKHEGREKRLSLGIYPETSILAARGLRDELEKLVDQGIDPSSRRKLSKIIVRKEIQELTREELIQRVLDLEQVLGYVKSLLLKYKEQMSPNRENIDTIN